MLIQGVGNLYATTKSVQFEYLTIGYVFALPRKCKLSVRLVNSRNCVVGVKRESLRIKETKITS